MKIITRALPFLLLLTVHSTRAQQRPNVIFILADDMGYGDAGCYGQQLIRTPHIDQLAKNGIKFTQFYAGTSVCAPSRSSLMTGQHTGHTPIRGNYEIEPEGQLPIPDSTFTMAEMFRKAGYATGAFGKWGLGFVGSTGDPVKQGFDRFYGYNCQRESHNYFPNHLWDNDTRVPLSNTLTELDQYAPQLIQDQIMHFMDDNQKKPFFLFLAYTLPHAGLQLPAGDTCLANYIQQFQEQPRPIKPGWNGIAYQPQAYPHAAYAAMVTRLDNYIGQVMQKVKRLGLDKNTLIIFASDNGPHREGGNEPAFFHSSAGFSGIKRSLHEGGIRVPLVACWPGKIRAGTASDFAGAFWDLLPTFAALAGQPVSPQVDGLSILPTLTANGKQQQHDYLYWEFHEEGGRQAVRLGNWKGIREKVFTDPSGPLQLFDLSTDSAEKQDVAAQHPDIVKRISDIMTNAHVENKDFPFAKKQTGQHE